jgi:hypothetical protein
MNDTIIWSFLIVFCFITVGIPIIAIFYTFLVLVPRQQRQWIDFYDITGIWPGADSWPTRKPNRPPACQIRNDH